MKLRDHAFAIKENEDNKDPEKCNTCIAWLVTLPELLATGLAVALTPPTSLA